MAAKFLYAEGCNSVSLVFYRYSLTLPVLFVMALWEQKGERKEGQKADIRKLMKITTFQMQQFVVLSAGFAVTPILLFASYNYISSGSATTIHFSYPVFVILASVFIFKEKATFTKAAAVLFCVAGLVLFYEPGQSGGVMGIVLALTSGITYTFYMMFFDRSELKFIKPFKTNFYLSLISAGLVLVFALITKTFVILPSAKAWFMAFGFSFMLTVVACVLCQVGIVLVGAQKTAVLSTFEPITSVVMGVICFHETVGIKTGLGVLFILAAVLSVTLFDKKKTQ